jgi:pyrimidine-nucleoside phosphorylase
MKSLEDSRRLARSLVSIGRASGVRTEAAITNMDAPLGRAVGNASEVIESLETLKGRGPSDVESLSVSLAARMLVAAGIGDEREAESRVRRALASGEGLETFRRIIENQGGNPSVVDDYSLLPSAPDEFRVVAHRAGVVGALDAEKIGRAAVVLGAGRTRLDDAVDHGVGIEVTSGPGARVMAGETLLILRHRSGHGLADAAPLAQASIRIDDQAPELRPLVLETVR